MSVNECKRAALVAQTGLDGHINDMELAWLQANGATSNNLNDAWVETLVANGITRRHINDMQYEWLGNLGATQPALQDRWEYFWCDLGGAGFGPVAIINRTVAGSCQYQDPATDCTAQSTLVGSGANLAGPIQTYTWTITAGNATITSGAGTDTITVDSTSGGNEPWTVKLDIFDGTNNLSATRNYTHSHTDTTALAFIGPDIPSQTFTIDQPYTLDVSALFSPAPDGYALQGTWPAGFSISNAGVITGTATAEASYTGLSVRASRSGDPDAVSNTFNGDAIDTIPATYYLSANFDAANQSFADGVDMAAQAPDAFQAGTLRSVGTNNIASNRLGDQDTTTNNYVVRDNPPAKNSRQLAKFVLTSNVGTTMIARFNETGDYTNRNEYQVNSLTGNDATYTVGLDESYQAAAARANPSQYAIQFGGFDANGVPDINGVYGAKFYMKVGAEWALDAVTPTHNFDIHPLIITRGGGNEYIDDLMFLDGGTGAEAIHTPIHLSTFTAPDGTDITAYTPDIGNAFVSDGAAYPIEIENNRVTQKATGWQRVTRSDVGVTEFFVSADVKRINGNAAVGVVVRCIDALNLYFFRYSNSGGVFDLQEVNAGTYTSRGTSGSGFSGGRIAGRTTTGDITGWNNGANQISYTSTLHNAGTAAGFNFSPASSSDDTWVDNFAVWPLTGYDQLDDYQGAEYNLIHKSTFTAADGPLNGHVPDIGNAWSDPSNALTIGSNQALSNTDLQIATTELGVTDFVSQCDADQINAAQNNSMQLTARTQDSDNTLYVQTYRYASGPLEIFTRQGGANTKRATVTIGTEATERSVKQLRMQCEGDVIKAWLNGKYEISYTTALFNTQTSAGIRAATTGDAHIHDNFRVWSLV